MNLPNKITMTRIILAVVILVMLIFPWSDVGITWKEFYVQGKILVDLRYLIAGFLFLIASVTDFVDGHIARSQNLVTDFGKVMDAIADKVLVNGLLIILAYQGFISVVVPVIIITRDIVVDSIRTVASGKGKVIAAAWPGKVKTIFMMIGVTLALFYNLPFELLNLRVDEVLILIATVLSIVSGVQYYLANKEFIFAEK